VRWNFGDNTTGTGSTVTHSYTASGIYQVQLIVLGASGCQDTVRIPVDVQVNSIPRAAIVADSTSCVNYTVNFSGQIQSIDAVNLVKWNLSNGVTSTSNPFSYRFTQPGLYTVQLITGTVNGCFDTTTHQVRVNPSPTVTASNDMVLCRGSSAPLNAAGINVATWSWSPLQGLSCYNCPNPIASPTATTPYLVQGTNSFGCSAWDTVVVTVIQPLRLSVSSADSICIGQSTNLL
jgi:PKD repeat protein